MPQSINNVTVPAPAKLNLHLAVKEKRPDGFHKLESVFLALDFGDTLYFETLPDRNALEIAMEWEGGQAGAAIPIEKNIIFRAVCLFREKTGNAQGLRVKVEKRIPPGSGMGGGSSDAASTLLALNKLAALSGGASCPLSRDSLLETAAVLGSDVPFFVYRAAAAEIRGRGESVKPIEAPRCFFVLVNPGFPSETATAFRLLDEHRRFHPPSFTPLPSFSLTSRPQAWPFRNDFLPVFHERESSVYSSIIAQLKELGAGFSGLSGAGSTCFGVFTDKTEAEKAVERLLKSWNFVKITFPAKDGSHSE